MALRVLTQPGDDVIVSRESHAVWHETGCTRTSFGPRTIRAVTHLDVSQEQCEQAAEILVKIAGS